MKGKLTFALLVFIFSMFFVSQSPADVFPSKPINLWVGWGAGSGTDISQRAIADIAAKTLKQPLVVSNITGGEGPWSWAGSRPRNPTAIPWLTPAPPP